jgi:hypothetical protein
LVQGKMKLGALDVEGRAHGDNGGPPLDKPHEWGEGPFGNYFEWRSAQREARKVPFETMRRRAAKAETLGLTYEEYTLEILERGRFLQASDTARIAEIKLKRPLRY